MSNTNYFVCTLGEAIEYGTAEAQGIHTVNDLLAKRASESSKRYAVGFPLPAAQNDRKNWDHVALSFGSLNAGVTHVAHELQSSMSSKSETRVVALLCSSSPAFLLSWLALIRSGFSVFLIAPQCAPSAVWHLCKSSKVSVMFYDPLYKDLARESARLGLEDKRRLELLEVFGSGRTREVLDLLEKSQGVSAIEASWECSSGDDAYYHHSSGTSSGLPKPIPQSHRAAVSVLPCLPYSGKASFSTTPLYHGGVADCFRAWTSGEMIWLFPGREVPITESNICNSLACASAASEKDGTPMVKYFSSVPYVLKMLAEDDHGLELLKNMDLVGVGGAALPPSAGDDLVNKGVNLVSRYGSAECGFLMSSHRDYAKDRAWQYLRSPSESKFLKFESQESSLSELVVAAEWPHVAKQNRDNGSFATSDLFEPHSTIPNAWKYHSRADSQLTLVTGKKFDPAPLEDSITTNPLLRDVLLVGNGRANPGALLFPSDDTVLPNDVLDQIWPQIAELNSQSQAHARLAKSMLKVVKADEQPLPKSSKGTILRNVAESMYEQEIEALYEGSANADGDSFDGQLPTDDEVPVRILEIIRSVTSIHDRVPADVDLFTLGVDSVACMQIRTLLQNRILGQNHRELPMNIVYDCGTIQALSTRLLDIRHGSTTSVEDELQQMVSMATEFSITDVPYSPSSRVEGTTNGIVPPQKHILLTGTTGLLGSHILAHLLSAPSPPRLTLLIRGASPEAARARLDKSLSHRQLAPLSSCDAVTVLAANLEQPLLDLDEGAYTTLRDSVTDIIHAAWPVNFSARLRSFAPALKGLRGLLELANSSTGNVVPRMVFCSSTASVISPYTAATYGIIHEQCLDDPRVAGPTGYARSKWVAEAICNRAGSEGNLKGKVAVVRLGQLCGATTTGVWNMSEAWPLMLSSVAETSALPDLTKTGERLDWLPVDLAARAVVEIMDAKTWRDTDETDGSADVFHVLNPSRERDWGVLLKWMKKRVEELDILEPKVWVERLEGLRENGKEHPSLKLLGLWKDAYCGENEGEGGDGQVFEMVKTGKVAPILEGDLALDEEQFGKMWAWIQDEMKAAKL